MLRPVRMAAHAASTAIVAATNVSTRCVLRQHAMTEFKIKVRATWTVEVPVLRALRGLPAPYRQIALHAFAPPPCVLPHLATTA